MSHQNITHKEIFMGSQFAEIRRYLSASFAIYKSELSYLVCNFETIFRWEPNFAQLPDYHS